MAMTAINNNSKKLVELNFSELNEEEKMRYFNFLMSNNIRFEEETDNYVATIKVSGKSNNKNPAAAKRNPSPIKNDFLNQDSQRGHRRNHSALNQAAGNVRVPNSNSQVDNTQKYLSAFEIASNNTRTRRAKNHSIDARSLSPYSRDSQISSTQAKGESLLTLLNKIDFNNNGETTRRESENRDNNKSITIVEDRNQYSTNEMKENNYYSQENPVESPFVKQLKQNSSRLKNVSSEYSSKFKKLYSCFKLAEKGFRPKRVSRMGTLKIIEEIYSAKFTRDTLLIKSNKNIKKNTSETIDNCFPLYVNQFFIEKYKNQKLAEQNALNMIASIEYHSRDHKEIELFSQFLTEEYDNEDLIFFLFLRSVLEKELESPIFNKHKQEVSDLTALGLTKKQCQRILTKVFGPEEKELIDQFMNFLQDRCFGQSQSSINSYIFLILTVLDYKKNRNTAPKQNNNRTDKAKAIDDKMIDMSLFGPVAGNQCEMENQEIYGTFANVDAIDNHSMNDMNLGLTFRFENDSFSQNRIHADPHKPLLLDLANSIEELQKPQYQALSSLHFVHNIGPEELNFQPPKPRILIDKPGTQEDRPLVPKRSSIQSLPSENNTELTNRTSIQHKASSTENKGDALTNPSAQYKSMGNKSENLADVEKVGQGSLFQTQTSRDFSTNSNREHNELEKKILEKMEQKVYEFVRTMIGDNEYIEENDREAMAELLERILNKKTYKLIDAIFTADKLKWLKHLLIETPTREQLNYVENLQKDFRALQKKKLDSLTSQDLSSFCKKILQIPELSAEILNLIQRISLEV